MDNRYFTILGHATGRLLLKRPGYQIYAERVLQYARKNGCFVEINSSPDRLDLSATNAHATEEFEFVACGIDQTRRAGLSTESVLNSRGW